MDESCQFILTKSRKVKDITWSTILNGNSYTVLAALYAAICDHERSHHFSLEKQYTKFLRRTSRQNQCETQASRVWFTSKGFLDYIVGCHLCHTATLNQTAFEGENFAGRRHKTNSTMIMQES